MRTARMSLVVGGVAILPLALASCRPEAPASTAPVTAPNETAHGSADPYVHGEPSPDGIGKFYMGREIAQVMSHWGASWLDRPERALEERTDLLLTMLDLEDDDVVADIGAGSGTLTLPIARLVPRGRVLAVDIQPEMLEFVAARAAEAGLANVETVLGTVDDARLPAGSVDVVVLVDAYHEFSHPKEMLDSIRRALKPDGRVVQVEFRANDPSVPIKPLHTMTEDQARREFAASGLVWISTASELPRQHVLTYGLSGPRDSER